MKQKIYMIMGVSGSGKTTIGKLLAKELSIPFLDGDDFHSASNKSKMQAGIPLTDSDREQWLQIIHEKAVESIHSHQSLIIACSALKKTYRDLLEAGIQKNIVWLYLDGDPALIEERMKSRKDHFMPTSLLSSQFAILEKPDKAITINISFDTNIIIQKIMEAINQPTLGIVGLGVMGKNLARNFARSGIKLALYNRHVTGKEEKIAEKSIAEFSELKEAVGFDDVPSFVSSLAKPRKIFMMIKAGEETDHFISTIAPHLESGDLLIDGGNSHYLDTKRRIDNLQSKQIHFIGTGISGGELGALNGPSIMPSGTLEAYKMMEDYLSTIAAKDKDENPCCAYIGPEGSGHFVKMIHNGMEYAEMQLIAETYAHLRYVACMEPAEIARLFSKWNEGKLKSYLLEITAQILLKKEGDQYLIDLILDVAGNKGTGNWATIAASELGIPATMITAALFARYVSTIKESITSLRQSAGKKYVSDSIDIKAIENAYTLARIINHQQGFVLLQAASSAFQWNLNLSSIARIWTNGCIIRSELMNSLIDWLKDDTEIFSNQSIQQSVTALKADIKTFCMSAIQSDLAVPCYNAALDYINALTSEFPTANIIQAQRDFFGAHTYQKRGDDSGKYYHKQW